MPDAQAVWQNIHAFLIGKGLSPAQAAGVEGNLLVESGFNPSAYNAKEGAIGLAQWEGDRRTQLQRFAAQRGTSETDVNTQRDFLWAELQGSEQAALKGLLAANTASDAATVFDQKYERSSGGSRQKRIDAANKFVGAADFADGAVGKVGDAVSGALDKLNPFANWQTDALGLGIKLVGSLAAVALVVAGVMHTVRDGETT